MSLSRWTLLLAPVVLAACPTAQKNQDACQRWVDSLDCGEFDFSAFYGDDYCEAFHVRGCDLEPYFDCLVEGSSCEGGVYTPALDCPPPIEDCEKVGPDAWSPPFGSDADVDADTDSDTDTDADADSDADADVVEWQTIGGRISYTFGFSDQPMDHDCTLWFDVTGTQIVPIPGECTGCDAAYDMAFVYDPVASVDNGRCESIGLTYLTGHGIGLVGVGEGTVLLKDYQGNYFDFGTFTRNTPTNEFTYTGGPYDELSGGSYATGFYEFSGVCQ